MRDAIELEWQGIPAVAIVHEALAGSADAMRLMSGMPHYPYLEVTFPLPPVGPWTAEQVDALCDELLPRIVDQLTHEVAGPAAAPEGHQAPMAMAEAGPGPSGESRRALQT